MNPRFIDDMSWRMGEVYAAVTDEILVNMARHFKFMTEGNAPSGAWEYQTIKLAEMGQVNQETEAIILKHLGDADGALRYVLEESIRDGLKNAEPALRKAAEKGFTRKASVPELAPNQMQAFRAFYNQSSDKLNLVNTVMLDSTQQAYQATVSDIVGRMQRTQGILNTETGEVVTGVTSMNKAVRQGVRKMVDNGITGFIDHGGHHWSPEAYVTMDIRTTMANTAREAVFERQEEYGSELFQVSHHDGARPLCYPWQGKVISRNGWSGEVEDDEGNAVHVTPLEETSYGEPAGLFGINCGHYPIPFFPGFSRIRPPEQDEETNAKEYKESQQQRALERDLRNEKRELAVMKAQGAPEDEIKAQKQRVANARDNLDAFCDKTGRARRSGREGTPINATFPDGYKQTYYERGIKRRNPFPQPTQTPEPNVASQATPQTAEKYTMIGHTEKLKRTMTEDEYNGFVQLVDGSETAKLYEQYGDSCSEVKRFKNAGRYTAWDAVEYDLVNYPGQSEYSVLAHEMGHMFDAKVGEAPTLTYNEVNKINEKCKAWSSATAIRVRPSVSDQFLSAMRKDKEKLEAILTNPEELLNMKKGSWRNSTSGVQDAMDGFFGTQDKNLLPWGHGNKYYNRKYNHYIKGYGLENELVEAYQELGFPIKSRSAAKTQCRNYETANELWANILSALTCGGDELKAFEQYMPETTEAARYIIRGL